MNNIIRKLTSRKLWMAIAGVSTGIAMSLGANSTEITSITGAIVSVISCVTFIVTEGKIDAERVKNAVEGIQDGLVVLQEDNQKVVTGFGGDSNAE
jgi:ATP-dependent RNA circularization protein (DNA/RNA ligase family)